MYNPASLASNVRDTGIWGGGLKLQPYFDPIAPAPPIDFSLPVIRIAPNDSVPMRTAGPTPGADQSWWDAFKDRVDNGAAWVWDRASLIIPEGDAEAAREFEAKVTKSNNFVMLAAIAAGAFLIMRK